MKTLFAGLAIATLLAAPAAAQYRASGPGWSYDCGPNQYDSSGAPVAHPCQ
jgi:hypothetical protein